MDNGVTSRHVVINAQLSHYEEHLAPEWAEHDPTIKMFLDSDCDRLPIEVALDPNNPNAVYDVQVAGLPKERPLHNLFAMGIKAYVRTTTHKGTPVSVDAGNDYVLIQDVLEAHRMNRPYVKRLQLRMPSVDGLLKGRVTVTIPPDGLDMGGADIGRPLTLASRFIGEGVDINAAARPLMAYINKTMQVRSSQMRERSQLHSRVRMPAYLGGPGMELTQGIPLPAAAFMLYEVPKSNDAFWVNAFAQVMARDGHIPSDWAGFNWATKTQVMKEVICYLPQYLPYKSDEADRNTRFATYVKSLKTGIEDFEGALEKWSGDCEDLAQAIMACRDALAQIDLSNLRHPALKEIQALARLYIAAMTLCTVTSAAVTGADDAARTLGAHMMVNMIPKFMFKEWVARADPVLAERLPFGTRTTVPSGSGINALQVGNSVIDLSQLKVLEAEGTGIYYSKPDIEAGQAVRRDLYAEPVFQKHADVPIFHEFGTHSPFYREGMTMLVPDFARMGANYIGFWYRNGADNARGVPYEDLENAMGNVQLVPHPEIPADVMDLMREDVKIRVPPNPLTLTDDAASVKRSMRHAEAERVCAAVESFGRRSSTGHDATPAEVFSTHELLTPEVADEMIATFRRKQGVYKVTYETEPRVDGLSAGIRLLMYDDVTQGRPMHVREYE